MKKLGFLFVTVIMLLLFAVSASALEPTGQCGDNVYWEYDSETKELVISGEGAMWDYDHWGDYDKGKSPFMESDIKSVLVKNDITTIGSDAFYGCSEITSIEIPGSVTSIAGDAFYNTAYYNNASNWENGVLYIGNHLIRAKTSITSCLIRQNTKSISNSAFYNCIGLTSITIPDSVTSIGEYAFSYCTSLTNITISDSVILIDDYAFYWCENLRSISIPDSVTSIGSYAFGDCTSLISLTIPDSVTSIGDSAFCNCKRLTNITLPDNVADIEEYAFNGCIALEKILVPEKVEKFYVSTINRCSSLRNLVIKNPGCEIVIGSYNIPENVILSGYTCSTIEQYAHENNYHFLPLDGENAGVIQNHQFSIDWKTVIPATCTERGLMVKVCNICSDVESEVIAPLGHTDKNSDNVCDSCDVTIAIDETPTQQPNQPEDETPQVEKNFFEKIIEWFRNLFNNLFGWLN